MRGGAKVAIVGGVLAAMAGTAGYGAYNLLQGITGGRTSASSGPAPVETGPPASDEIRETAQAFLAAWAKGDTSEAAGLTDDRNAASEALTDYTEDAHVTKVTLKAGTATGAKVPFTVKATVSYDGQAKAWAYDSALTVVRATNGGAVVKWQPSVVHPKLTAGASLMTGEAAAPQIEITDRNGEPLDAADYPSLGSILPELRTRYAGKLKGTPGTETYIRASAADGSDDAADETLLTLAKGTPGKLSTTLDADIQAAAEKAVKQRDDASVVAVKPSTGAILAVANNTSDGANNAFMAQLAPGSTFKVVTAATLMEQAGVTPEQPVPCEKSANYLQGQLFTNVEGSSDPAATFAGDFAASCNTAFVSLAGEIGDSALSEEATEVFGLNKTWSIGVPSYDGSVPSGSGDEKAAQMIGQGTIQMSPLNMASVAATAKNGTFLQPRVVDPGLIDGDLATADRPLGATAAQNLREMMRRTATSGTASSALAALGGDKGGKTGSAEVGGQAVTNSWFLAFRDDVAASAVVISGGRGGESAGPIVAAVLAPERG